MGKGFTGQTWTVFMMTRPSRQSDQILQVDALRNPDAGTRHTNVKILMKHILLTI